MFSFLSAAPRMWRRLALLLLASLALFTAACSDKQNDPQPAPAPESAQVQLDHVAARNIVQIVQANPVFSALEAAVLKTDLAGALSGPGPLTVLAPTDFAFAQLPAPFHSARSINAITDPEQIAALRGILLYHAVAGAVRAADFPAGASTATTLRPATPGVNDNTVYVSKDGRCITLNGNADVLRADVTATNGVIHVIGKVLLPPSSTVAGLVTQAAADNPAQFTLLLKALQRPAAAALLTATADAGANLTVFAPTDAAFRNLLQQLHLTSLDQVPDATLVAVLRLHVLGSRVFSSDLRDGQTAAALGGPLRVRVFGPFVAVRGAGNTAPATVRKPNLLATNGVVHVIDRVLLP